MYSIKQNRLLVVTIISLLLNVAAAIILLQRPDLDTLVNEHEKTVKESIPLDYETFTAQWGKAWIGVNIRNVTPAEAARAMLDRPEGAYVNSVTNGSPAQKADIEPGNIILSFNGRKIRDALQFQNDLFGSEVGSDIYMCVSKNDYTITVNMRPEERPDDLPQMVKLQPFLGVTVIDISDDSYESEKLDDAEKEGGVLVLRVVPGSPAEKGGLLPGDIIMSFNSRKTRTLREFLSDLFGCQPGQTVRMCIIRNEYRKTLYLTLERYIL